MIVEWILRANRADLWGFKEKTREYKSRTASGTLQQPDMLDQDPVVSAAFWKLYENFTPYRNTLAHAGGATVGPAGEVEICSARTGKTLTLDNLEQAAYLRFACNVAKVCLAGCGKTRSVLELPASLDFGGFPRPITPSPTPLAALRDFDAPPVRRLSRRLARRTPLTAFSVAQNRQSRD
jgi:hypothetical protein